MKKLNKKALERIRELLIAQKKELQSKSYNHEVDMEGDDTDIIQGKLIATINSKLSSRDKEKLQKIENALQKMEEKTFGICEECGDLIAEKRLEFNPWFSNCISCSEANELELKRKALL